MKKTIRDTLDKFCVSKSKNSIYGVVERSVPFTVDLFFMVYTDIVWSTVGGSVRAPIVNFTQTVVLSSTSFK